MNLQPNTTNTPKTRIYRPSKQLAQSIQILNTLLDQIDTQKLPSAQEQLRDI